LETRGECHKVQIKSLVPALSKIRLRGLRK
jgi:hypothetical protein